MTRQIKKPKPNKKYSSPEYLVPGLICTICVSDSLFGQLYTK